MPSHRHAVCKRSCAKARDHDAAVQRIGARVGAHPGTLGGWVTRRGTLLVAWDHDE
jgi:hypothetical protein